jgi:putative transposase
VRKGISPKRDQEEAERVTSGDDVLSVGRSLHCRIRYFTDGAVIGSRMLVDEVFRGARERFGPRRKSGARRLKGAAAVLAGEVWSLRDP